MYFGGAEGGATHSNLVICNEKGVVVGKAKGPGTNHWSVGIDECANRVLAMVHAAKEDAGIPREQPLDSLGLTLSGCAQDSSNAELASRVAEKDLYCSKAFYVATDTAGSLFTAAPNGGMVIIAGTGSNALLLTSEGEKRGCGGWGHLLGDEGGAYWIAHRAVKSVFDDMDGLRISPHPIHKTWELIQEHFGVDNRDDLLPHAYKCFDKSKFAALTVKLSALAQSGDELSRHTFSCAGAALGAHVAALASKARSSRLRVVCVGSVWNSWGLLKQGFLYELTSKKVNTELELVKLRVSSAMGASWLAAKHIGYSLPRDDTALCQVFYTFTPGTSLNGIDSHTNGVYSNTNGVDNNTNGSDSYTNGGDSNTNGGESITNRFDRGTNGFDSGTNGFDSGANGVDDSNGFNEINHGSKVNGDRANGDRNGIECCGCDTWKNWS